MINVLYVIVGLVMIVGLALTAWGIIAVARALIRWAGLDITPGDLVLWLLVLISVLFISWATGAALVGGGS